MAPYFEQRISFLSIPRVIEQAMDAHAGGPVGTLDEVRDVDRWARLYSQNLVR